MTYIHPDDSRIQAFARTVVPDRSSLQAVSASLLAWFDNSVAYSRLNAPFFPLQRSDLDVISMRSGTCGDYSNLIISVLLHLGFEAMYAYVHTDCYGDEQDHICAAARLGEQWILIDATLPYRQWYGFGCPHRKYELLSPTAFEEKMKQEEFYWIDTADRYGNALYAGLFYAPWIHERIVCRSDTVIDSVFYLVNVDQQKDITIYAYYLRYSKDSGSIPVMSAISDGRQAFRFSCRKPKSLWDDEQWSGAYSEGSIPDAFQTKETDTLIRCISEDLPAINRILAEVRDPDRTSA